MIVTVQALVHPLLQYPFMISGQQRVPTATPDYFEYVPICAAKGAFQLLNDLAVASHRTIQTLQVAVHDQNQIIQLFPGSNINGA